MKIVYATTFYYRVKEGETLKSLLNMFNSSKENILRNNKNIELYPGEVIKIKINDYRTHIVKPTENLESIASIYKIEKDKLKRTNDLKTERLYIGQMLKIY